MFERLFKLKENATDVKTEALAGITTFMTMAYIICVQPVVLSKCGMDFGFSYAGNLPLKCACHFLMGVMANFKDTGLKS